jgi:hypothetical protein
MNAAVSSIDAVIVREARSPGARATLVPCGRGTVARQPEEEVYLMRDEEHPHQCPYCDLRFLYASEIRDHVLHDHTEHAESFLYVETHELP